MKKILPVFLLSLMSVLSFAQNYTMVPVQLQNGQLIIDGAVQLVVNPYDPSEVQLEPMNNCRIAVPSEDQMYSIQSFTVEEMLNGITNSWLYWSSNLVTVWPDEAPGYAFLKFSNGKYGYAKFDMSVAGGWQEFGYFQAATGVSEIEINYSIYPNPSTEIITVNAENFRAIDIYNNAGQLVYSTNESIINVSNFTSGVYFVSVVFNNGDISVKKMVKK